MRLTALVVATGFFAISGNELYQNCTAASGSLQAIFCVGYVTAVSDSLISQRLMCAPEGAQVGQAMDVIVDYLRAHPEQRQRSGYSLAELALVGAFPCK